MEGVNAIQILIDSKDYEQLTDQERNLVLSEITEEEYRMHREIITAMIEVSQEDQQIIYPSPRIRDAAYRALKVDKTGFIGWLAVSFNRPIPTYSLLLPFLLLIFIVPFMINNKSGEQYAADVETQATYDTVFLEKKIMVEVPVEVSDTVRIEKVVEVPVVKYVQSRSGNINYSDVSFGNRVGEPTVNLKEAEEMFNEQLNRIGKSASADKRLDQFLTEVR